MWTNFVAPFFEYSFARDALVAAILLSLSFSAIGITLVSRRLALVGDTMSHAMLPGVIFSAFIFGTNVGALFIGGTLGTFVLLFFATNSKWVNRFSGDSILALFSIFSLAVGVMIASAMQNQINLMHLLFGQLFAIDRGLLIYAVIVGFFTIGTLFYGKSRWIVYLTDAEYFRRSGRLGFYAQAWVLGLFAANLALGFVSLGALMTVGLLIFPALIVRPFVRSVTSWWWETGLMGCVVAYIGVLLSYHQEWPPGPTIVVVAFVCLVLSQLVVRVRRGTL